MEHDAAQHKTKTGSARTLLILAAVGIVVFSAFGFWLAYVNAPVTDPVPARVMPWPNARDYYEAAANAVVDELLIDTASHNSCATAEHEGWRPNVPSKPLSWAEKERVVRRNAGTEQLIRQGLAFEYLNSPYREIDVSNMEFNHFRILAELLRMDAQVRAHKGDYAGAVRSCLDACRFGSDVPKGGPGVAAHVGVVIQTVGRAEAWDVVDRLGSGSARSNARRMEAVAEKSISAAEAFTNHKWATVGGLVDSMHRRDFWPSWRSDASFGERASDVGWGVRYVALNKRRMLADFVSFADAEIALCKRPYPARSPHPPIPRDYLNQMLCRGWQNEDFEFELNSAMNRMLSISLALRAYCLEHGGYPEDLRSLVPGYLRRLPPDPFALKGTFGYLRKAKRYVLYSIGPDGVDNKGTPIPAAPRAARKRTSMFADVYSKGDIVAGVNGN